MRPETLTHHFASLNDLAQQPPDTPRSEYTLLDT